MKKRIIMLAVFAIPILVVLLSLMVSAIGTQLVCLRDGEKIMFSECNPNMENYICGATSCQLCINEIRTGVYCPESINSCNDVQGGCKYLYEQQEPDQPDQEKPVITLLAPSNGYSKENPGEIEFSFKATLSYELEICKLIVNEEPVASKSKPISLSTQRLYYTAQPGVYTWKIECTRRSTYGGDEIISESRSFLVGNANEITMNLISPENNYITSGAQDIAFSFNFSSESLLEECSLVLNENIVNSTDEINITNTLSYSVSPGDYSWNIKCLMLGNNLTSETRNLTINSPVTLVLENSGGGGGGGSGGLPIYLVSSQQLSEGVTKNLTQGAKIQLNILNGTHYVQLNSLASDSVNITVSSAPQTFTLATGAKKKVDLNSDNIYDLLVELKSIVSGRAEVGVKTISEAIQTSQNPQTETTAAEEATTTETTETNTETEGVGRITGAVVGVFNKDKFPIVAAFIIVVVFIVVMISYFRRGKKE